MSIEGKLDEGLRHPQEKFVQFFLMQVVKPSVVASRSRSGMTAAATSATLGLSLTGFPFSSNLRQYLKVFKIPTAVK